MKYLAKLALKALDGVGPFLSVENELHVKFDSITIKSNKSNAYNVEFLYNDEVIHAINDVCADFSRGDTIFLSGINASMKVDL